ncbi:MAG: hypothetical protein CMJ84_14515 [Planctomycetes bacterium]|nr:hypothetical protein [Planctomycetota bacterium]
MMTGCLATLVLQNFDPPWFWLLVVVGSIAATVLAYRTVVHQGGRGLSRTLLALRLLGVAVLLVALVRPAWLSRAAQVQDAQVAVIVDDSQSMGQPHDPGDNAPVRARYDQAQHWIHESDAGRKLSDRFEVHVFGVDGRKAPVGSEGPGPIVEHTDLVRSLHGAAARLRGGHLRAVLLISDGQDNSGRRQFLEIDEYPVPIHCVGFPQPPREGDVDLAIVSVEAPERARIGDVVPIRVLVSADGGAAADAPVTVEVAGRTLAGARVEFKAGETRQPVTLDLTPDTPGSFVMTVRVGGAAGERRLTNNAREMSLTVGDDPMRVLYIEGHLRSEYTYLRNRLANDPDVDLATFVRSANPDDVTTAGVLMDDRLLSPQRMEKLDVVILGDFEASMLSREAYEQLSAWVDAGGGLIVLAGYRNVAADGLIATPLAPILPVDLAGAAQLDAPFAFEPTELGARHPVLAITGDFRRDASMWAQSPSLPGIAAVGLARPGAEVLARHPRRQFDSDKGHVVLAVQRYGEGRVAVLTADTTWRWSRIARLAGRADALYARFWSQMVRWLAGRDEDEGAHPLTVTTDAPAYDRGQRVTVQVRRDPAAIVPGPAGSAMTPTVTVRSPDGRLTQLVGMVPGVAADAWKAHYFPDRGGRFEVTAGLASAAAEGDTRDVVTRVTHFNVRGAAVEMNDPGTNPALLRRFADRTGGLYASVDDGAAGLRIVESLPSAPRITYETKKAQLWSSPWLFILFLVVVTIEWVVRRRNRMV